MVVPLPEGPITASNFHKAAAKPEHYIREKLNAKLFSSDATLGVGYEDVACLLYRHYNHTEVTEYGFLPHPTIAHNLRLPALTGHPIRRSMASRPYQRHHKDIP
jgi:hypothetical protein